ncbi:hypothetical protein C8J56DRAFT_1066735 [Mycena floridula]|nr:hypothetical protein C8J56DRAFT_1066735 [Mycena floridula]
MLKSTLLYQQQGSFFSTAAAAAVNNWFDQNIKHAEKLRHIWMGGKFPILHAFTLLLVHRFRPIHIQLRDCPPDDQPPDQELFLVQKAWEIQMDGNCRVPTMAIDVDCEAIQALEEAMFTDSADAGKAGYCQWGLDAGPHQEGWKPWHVWAFQQAGVMMMHICWKNATQRFRTLMQPEDSLNREEAGDDYADKYVPKGKLKHQTSLKQAEAKLTQTDPFAFASVICLKIPCPQKVSNEHGIHGITLGLKIGAIIGVTRSGSDGEPS